MKGCDGYDGRNQSSRPDGPKWYIPEGDKTRISGAMCKSGPYGNSIQGGGQESLKWNLGTNKSCSRTQVSRFGTNQCSK